MKSVSSIATLLLITISSSTAFAPVHQQNGAVVTSSSSLSMGLFDMFSEESRKARADAKQKEIEEQEELQRQILDRRNNPDKMEDYEARVAVRRRAYMADRDDLAKSVQVMKGSETTEDVVDEAEPVEVEN